MDSLAPGSDEGDQESVCISVSGNVVTLSISADLQGGGSETCFSATYGVQVTQGTVLDIQPATSYVFPPAAQPGTGSKVLGMSLYAFIGIVVGAGVILVAALAVFFIRKHRLRRYRARIDAVNLTLASDDREDDDELLRDN